LSIKVVLPTALARHTAGQRSFESQAEDLAGLLAEFDSKYPALAQNVKDANGKLRRFVNVYVNDEDIRFLGGEAHRFADGDEVMLIPSIAGGADPPPGADLSLNRIRFSEPGEESMVRWHLHPAGRGIAGCFRWSGPAGTVRVRIQGR
jgi:molybdopterin converting factor small subunit